MNRKAASGSVLDRHLFAVCTWTFSASTVSRDDLLHVWASEPWPSSFLLRQWINTGMFLYLLSGRSKNRADFWGGQAKSTLCSHQEVQTWGQSQNQVSWSINSTSTAIDEPGPSQSPVSSNTEGTRDGSGDGLQWECPQSVLWVGLGHVSLEWPRQGLQ